MLKKSRIMPLVLTLLVFVPGLMCKVCFFLLVENQISPFVVIGISNLNSYVLSMFIICHQ